MQINIIPSLKQAFFLRRSFLFPLGLFCEIRFLLELKRLCSSMVIHGVGILMGFAFVEPQNLQHLQYHVAALAEQYDINLPDLSRMEAEWTRLRNNIPEVWKFNNDGREFKVGEAMKARGLSAEYPVVLIPGIVSTVGHHSVVFWTFNSSQPSVFGIMVNGPCIPSLLQREALGWF